MRTRPALLAARLLTVAALSAVASSAIAQKADIAKGQALAGQVCAACHNADGNSAIAANPILAGQFSEYLAKQLINFKANAEGKAERSNPIMAAQVASLSTDDMRNLASYYSQQKMKPQSARQKDLVDMGQRIFRGGIADKGVPACAGCHGPTGAGIPSQYPRLSGQHAAYTDAQLKAWRVGERANDGPARTMRTIATKLSDREIAAVSDYIAGLR